MVAAGLQHGKAAQPAGLPASGAGGHQIPAAGRGAAPVTIPRVDFAQIPT